MVFFTPKKLKPINNRGYWNECRLYKDAVGLTVVDKETMYISMSPSPGVQETSSPPTESRGTMWRFPTALGTGQKSLGSAKTG